MPMVWLYRGQWNEYERLQDFSPEDVNRAVAEDWGQLCGYNGNEMKPIDKSPHPAADAFYAARKSRSVRPPDDGRDEPPPAAASIPPAMAGGPLYDTREMRAEEPTPKRGPGRPRKTET